MKSMIQTATELNEWHSKDDPWDYRSNLSDQKRKDLLAFELPKLSYHQVLDIGCGQGFVTRELPGKHITGVDISDQAIKRAKRITQQKKLKHISFKTGNLFEINSLVGKKKFDLVVITGVLYPQYIGDSSTLVYHLIDQVLAPGGILASVHIEDWYSCRFPYLKIREHFYKYREFFHRLEIYCK